MKRLFPILFTVLLAGCHGYEVENGKWSLVDYNEGFGRMVVPVDGADQNSFKPINRDYAKDNQHVYLGSHVLMGADPNTFIPLEYQYSKDDQRVFFMAQEIKNADPGTFQVIEQGWSKDKNEVYTGSQPLKVADLASFRILHIGLLNEWAKDNDDYYISGHTGRIDCDYPTMKILNDSYGIDKDRAYYSGIPIEGVDVKTFRATDVITAKDKYRRYVGEKVDQRQ